MLNDLNASIEFEIELKIRGSTIKKLTKLIHSITIVYQLNSKLSLFFLFLFFFFWEGLLD